MENTQDLSQFGHIERDEAALLLSALNTSKDLTKFLGDGVAVEFNPMSGNVFLVDEDYNVGMMNGAFLEDFHNCPNCGAESIASDFREECTDECCKEYADELGL